MDPCRQSLASLRCTFCGKRGDAVDVIIRGPQDSAICDACVELAREIIEEQRTGRDWAARVAAIDQALGTREPVSAEDAALLIERAQALTMLSRAPEAVQSLERVLEMPVATGPAELRIHSARALRMWIQLSEMLGTPFDPIRELDRIDEALGGLPGDDMPAAVQWRAELMVEKALLLERAGRNEQVDDLLGAMIDRFEHLDDPHAAQAAAWALRNRIAARLDRNRDDEALADADRLRALWARAPVSEHVAAVWKLLMQHGHDAAATRLVSENFDNDLKAAVQELPLQRARTHLAALVTATQMGDADAADKAALQFVKTLRSAPNSPELAELLDLLRAEFATPREPDT